MTRHKAKEQQYPYPQNFAIFVLRYSELIYGWDNPTKDQIDTLEYLTNILTDEEKKYFNLRFRECRRDKEIQKILSWDPKDTTRNEEHLKKKFRITHVNLLFRYGKNGLDKYLDRQFQNEQIKQEYLDDVYATIDRRIESARKATIVRNESALRTKLNEKNVTPEEISERVNISSRRIENLACGNANINKASVEELYRIATAIGCHIEDIIETSLFEH